ncbi:MAG: radical SAM protein, partial [Candidatus Omnitrophica bacterium]|nr:radical SAM protein [Candidatus Omnitrophota bacterium]
YGIEVGNEEVLKSINKGTTLEQARIALKETRKAGILSQGLFMLGLPQDTEDSCRDTINFAKEINPDLVKFNVATPYPGSRFFEDFIKERTISRPETLTSWADWTVSSGDLFYIPKGIDSDTLRYLQRMAMLSFYIRPKIILRHLIKRTVGYKNIFYGGLWLVTLFYRGIIKKIWNSVFLRMGIAK